MRWLPIFFYSIRLIFRARFLTVTLFSVLFLSVAVLLAGQFAGRQPETVSLDVGISVIRLVLPFIIVLLSQELISSEFGRRYFLGTLTYPCTRFTWLAGRFFALSSAVVLIMAIMAIVLVFLVGWVGGGYSQATPVDLGFPYLVVIGFIAIDAMVLISLSILIALLASVPSFVLLGVLGFMLAARSFSAIINLLARDSSVVPGAEVYGAGVSLLGYMLPDLGALDVRGVALYGQMEFLSSDWLWLIMSCASYSLALLGGAAWIFNRRRFS